MHRFAETPTAKSRSQTPRHNWAWKTRPPKKKTWQGLREHGPFSNAIRNRKGRANWYRSGPVMRSLLVQVSRQLNWKSASMIIRQTRSLYPEFRATATDFWKANRHAEIFLDKVRSLTSDGSSSAHSFRHHLTCWFIFHLFVIKIAATRYWS